ncbi:MAG: VOC family protein [Chloroflexi bacterium]|nr:VOC family protein [Chloroflexota bacterium]
MSGIRDGLPIAPGSGIWRLSHLLLHVRDLERSVAFYERLLGLSVREHGALAGGRPYVSMAQGIGLTAATDAETASFDHIALRCPGGIDGVRRLLDASGIDHEAPRRTPYGLSIYFRDPDGHRVECHDSTGFGGDGAEGDGRGG